MAKAKRRAVFYNFILGFSLIVLIALSAIGCGTMTSLGLDQEVRCGQTEHIHSPDCYIDDVLICVQKAHTHDNGCYLLLLEDNDVNRLILSVSQAKKQTLEEVIDTIMEEAIRTSVTDPSIPAIRVTPTMKLTASDIKLLNGALNTTNSGVALNENLGAGTALSYGVSTLAAIPSDVSSAIVTDATNDNPNRANFYVYFIDEKQNGGWAYLGTSEFESNSSSVIYINHTISTNDVISIVNNALGTTYNSDSLPVAYYSTSSSESTWKEVTHSSSGSTSLGQSYIWDDDSSARYVYIGAGNSQDANPSTKYIRVSYEASSTPSVTASTTYYTVGTSITLPSLADGYLWEDQNGIRYEPGTQITPSYSLKLKPVTKSLTVVFINEGKTVKKIEGITPGSTISSDQLPTGLTREHYTLNGWTENSSGSGEIFNFNNPITSSKTFYAVWVPVSYDVTVIKKLPDGTVQSSTTTKMPYESTVELDDAYTWTATGSNYSGGNEITIQGDTVLTGTHKKYTVTCIDENDDDSEHDVLYGKTFTLDELPDGWSWLGSDGVVYPSGGTTAAIYSNLTFTATKAVTASFVNTDGSTYYEPQSVTPGSSIILPNPGTGYVWVDEDGQAYTGGNSVTLTENTVFTRSKSITLNYTMNFPSLSQSTFYDNYGNRLAKPAMAVNSGTTYSETFNYGDRSIVAESLTHRNVYYDGDGNGSQDLHYSVYFKGWEVTAPDGTTHLIEPGTNLTWQMLEEYAGTGTEIDLKGVWEYGGLHTISFFIEYNAKAPDTSTGETDWGSGSYTPEVFATHLFITGDVQTQNQYARNEKLWAIVDDSDDNSSEADSNIRKLHNEGVLLPLDESYTGEQSLFYTLNWPDDDVLLAELKEYFLDTGKLSYDDGHGNQGTITDASQIDSDHFTIRWYVFKPQGDDWHIDGRLVKKVGTIKVSKNFGGNAKLVEAAIAATEAYGTEKVFINATCKGYYKTVDGEKTFVSYSTPKEKQLFFFESTAEGDGGYTYDAATDTYSWIISEVDAHEEWVVEEFPALPEDSLDLSEWIWVDTINNSSDSGTTTTTTVTGITQPADLQTEDWLKVDFTNIYHKENTILVRKVDGKSLDGLPGAVFNLYRQVDGEERLMYFTYNTEEKIYEWVPDPSTVSDPVCDLPVNQQGFLEYTVGGFSYEDSPIIVREKTPPNGYAVVGDVTVGYLSGDGTIGILNADSNDAAEYQNGILTVKNYSDGTANVTANKVWDCDESNYKGLAVRFELMANGERASAVIPGFAEFGSYYVYLDSVGAYVTTNAQGKPNYISNTPWSFTWEGLPTVVSGEAIVYSIVETQIGDETAGTNNNFPNWISSELYNTVSTDEKGNQTVSIGIQNTTKRAMVRLTKYDSVTNQVLPGAEFTLVEVENTGNRQILVTDEYGSARFDNLKYETWYALTESRTPSGYLGFEDTVYIRLSQTGIVTVTTDPNDPSKAHPYVIGSSLANNILAYNIPLTPLPETGGVGGDVYRLGGLLLMLAAAAWFLYSRLPGTARFPAGAWKNEAEDRNPKLRRSRFPRPQNPIPREPTPPHGKEEPNSS